MSEPVLAVIIASTRPTRVGGAVGHWFADHARAHGAFAVEVHDLAELKLPLMDEPHHPQLRKYVHAHTLDWSARIDRADAVAIVTPEYNHAMPATLKNALDYLYAEWNHKPVGLVSYGGISAGLRSAAMLRGVLTVLKMVPLTEAVSIPFVANLVSEDKQVFTAPDLVAESATVMLDELARVAPVLAQLRS